MSWWCQTALGTYVFHYYFSDQIGLWIWHVSSALAWDATGLLTYAAILAICLLFAAIVGSFCHHFRISPVFLYERFAGRKGVQHRRVHEFMRPLPTCVDRDGRAWRSISGPGVALME